LIRRLRQEIYSEPYGQIPWSRHRDTLAPSDRLNPLTREARAAFKLMGVFDRWHLPFLRQRALSALAEHLDYEDRATHFIRIGPVNAVLNTLVHHFREPGGEGVRRSFETLDGYLWEDELQTQMNGYNSTALWDTAFATQAILATPFAGEQRQALQRAHGYIDDNQVLDELPCRDAFFRHRSRGGWPFSDRLHGWPITDCTAEGLKCAVALQTLVDRPIEAWRLEAAADLILSFQNPDGGWATYELQRAGAWLERLNPSQVFERIMVDYPYVECSSACVQALTAARGLLSPELRQRTDAAVARGVKFIRREQRQDGSWEGSWGVCFTYGTWFGVWGLMAAGAAPGDPAVDRACSFLLRHQNPDGGWGEHFDSCTRRRYVNHDQSHPVQTAWALLTLARAGRGQTEPARRAARWLIEAQQPDGDWPHQALVGVFNRTTLIRYDNYRRYFPIWALSLLEG
jgi:squalene/oxidosqualene cyclase-like protein